LILTDINMPRCDGLEMTKALRATTFAWPTPKLVACTASCDVSTITGTFDDVLVKPVGKKTLESVLASL